MKPNNQIANLLKALAHPARIRILHALAVEGKTCVCYLEATSVCDRRISPSN